MLRCQESQGETKQRWSGRAGDHLGPQPLHLEDMGFALIPSWRFCFGWNPEQTRRQQGWVKVKGLFRGNRMRCYKRGMEME
ncbi:hypothetical protein EYF80_019642 [Liparis tanakae]|uniref:Uncharacterized protein n=1 Tax=Liparis tanakae TaxID=230148 RepID=A0A4Z2HX49_9TELE|nr:hypothetical protein EYF80_019642 [Liparis tanakae]